MMLSYDDNLKLIQSRNVNSIVTEELLGGFLIGLYFNILTGIV